MTPDTPPSWSSPTITGLTTQEIDTAIRAGGYASLRDALEAKLSGQAEIRIDYAQGRAGQIIDDYRLGNPVAISDVLTNLDTLIRGSLIHTAAVQAIASWIILNPGQVVPGSPYGHKRIFS